jgi:hypothetical protein
MGLNLGPSYGAGGVADALEKLIMQRRMQEQLQQGQQRIDLEREAQAANLKRQQEQDAINRSLLSRKVATENVGMLEGMPAADVPLTQAEGQGGALASRPMGMAASPGVQAPNRFKAIPIPGVPQLGVEGSTMRPQTQEEQAQQAARAAILKLRTTPQKVARGEKVVLDGETIAEGNPYEQPHSNIYREYQDALSTGYKGSFSQYQNEDANRKRSTASNTGLTPEALAYWGKYVADTGNIPAFGMGAGARVAVANEAPKYASGQSAASAQGGFKADVNSLSNLVKMTDNVTAFENTAGQNADMLINAGKRVIDSGAPWVNTPLRSVNQRALGTADVPVYNAARQVVLNEYARILSSANMSGVLSDQARKEVESFLPENATLKQTVDVLSLLKRDAANRKRSYLQQIDDIKRRIAKDTKPSDSTEQATGAGGELVWDPVAKKWKG